MRIFVSAGEPSGDLHGGNLVRELHRLRPGLDCVAQARGTVTCTETEFLVDLELDVTRGGEPFHARRWQQWIPRRGC